MAKYGGNVSIEYFLFVIVVVTLVCDQSQTSTFLQSSVPQVPQEFFWSCYTLFQEPCQPTKYEKNPITSCPKMTTIYVFVDRQ